jgi:hypothetical protein
MYVYVIRNSATGKVYIGQHKGTNLKKYLQDKFSQANYELKRKGKGGGSHLFASMRKHPREVWSIEPLIEGIETKPELDRLERLLIAIYDTRNPDVGYNICRGGEGFTGKHSPEWKARMSTLRREMGQRPTDEATAKSIDVRKAIASESGLWPGAPLQNMEGKSIQGVTVLERADNNDAGDAFWVCKCHCGSVFKTAGSSLRSGHTKSCGCLKKQQDKANLSRLINMVGFEVNGIRVSSRAPATSAKEKEARWLCICHCGAEFSVPGGKLRSGNTTSCGCQPEHSLPGRVNCPSTL